MSFKAVFSLFKRFLKINLKFYSPRSLLPVSYVLNDPKIIPNRWHHTSLAIRMQITFHHIYICMKRIEWSHHILDYRLWLPLSQFQASASPHLRTFIGVKNLSGLQNKLFKCKNEKIYIINYLFNYLLFINIVIF